MFNKKFSLLIIVLLLVFSVKVFAIDGLTPSKNKDYFLEYTMSPETPQPNQIVKLDIRSYFFDINSAQVFFYEDNNLVKNGIGIKKFTFKAPNGGSKKKVTIIVKDIDGKTYRQDIFIRPVEVTLVYEVEDAYKPEFYQGKAYALSNSKIKFRAFSDFFDSKGDYISPDNLIYSWFVNFKKDFQASGYGKKTFTINRLDAYPVETIVQVKVSDSRLKIKGSSALFLNPEDGPTVDFYEVPIAEPFKFKNIAKDGVLTLNGLEGKIRAIPYFMDNIENPKYPIFYKWMVNGKKVFKPLTKDLTYLDIAVDADSDARGANLRFEIENKMRPFQYVEESLRLIFKDDNSSSEELENPFNTSHGVNINNKNQNEDGGFFGLF